MSELMLAISFRCQGRWEEEAGVNKNKYKNKDKNRGKDKTKKSRMTEFY